jgi:hypothetical protein
MALRRLLWRRRQSRATLSSTTCHYAAEQVARSVTDLGRLRLRWAVVLRVLAGAAAGFKFALQLGNSLLISAIKVSVRSVACQKLAVVFRGRWIWTRLLCFYLVVRLLKRVNLAADQFNLLNMTGNWEE